MGQARLLVLRHFHLGADLSYQRVTATLVDTRTFSEVLEGAISVGLASHRRLCWRRWFIFLAANQEHTSEESRHNYLSTLHWNLRVRAIFNEGKASCQILQTGSVDNRR